MKTLLSLVIYTLHGYSASNVYVDDLAVSINEALAEINRFSDLTVYIGNIQKNARYPRYVVSILKYNYK